MTGGSPAVYKDWVTKFLAKSNLAKRSKKGKIKRKVRKRENIGTTALQNFKNLLSFPSAKDYPHLYENDFFLLFNLINIY